MYMYFAMQFIEFYMIKFILTSNGGLFSGEIDLETKNL